jgi:hypothetical protein
MMDGLYRIGVKLFCSAGSEVDLAEFIPIFHRWIQQKQTSLLLIDVADYSHVPQGPGVMLIAHEGHFAIDEQGGTRGLCYSQKRPLDGDLASRITAVARMAANAAQALEREPELEGRLRFSATRIRVSFNDRLHAPNSDVAHAAVTPALERFFDRVFAGEKPTCSREADPRARLSVTAEAVGARGGSEELGRRLATS